MTWPITRQEALPPKGDDRQEETLLAVGRALTVWEWMEGNRAVLYAEMVYGRPDQLQMLTTFGNCMDCGKRIEMIRDAIDLLFEARQEPTLHKQLRKLIGRALNLAGRRNEIAHGIVQPRPLGGYALVPAYYAIKKGAPFLGPATPTYAYRAQEIDEIRAAFSADYHETFGCLNQLISYRRMSAGITLAVEEPQLDEEDDPLW